MRQEVSVAAIIQARMESMRLPGKSLKKVFKNLSLLELVIRRVSASKNIDLVVLATSINSNCDPLVDLAKQMGISVVRGSEADVLGRFVKVIDFCQPEAIVRVCADNPLVSPQEIDLLVEYYEKLDLDYASNHTPDSGLPDGLGAEIVRADLLRMIADQVTDHHFREHVTNYIGQNQEKYRIGTLRVPKKLWYPQARLDINTKEDLENLRKFVSGLPPEEGPLWSSQVIVDHAKSLRL
jgi:spore coat polysaccharide biosynthesis protein SpsF